MSLRDQVIQVLSVRFDRDSDLPCSFYRESLDSCYGGQDWYHVMDDYVLYMYSCEYEGECSDRVISFQELLHMYA